MNKKASLDEGYSQNELHALTEKGVKLVSPGQVYVSRAVSLERIHPGVVLHPFVRLEGEQTFLAPGCVVGNLGPVTLKDTWCGEGTVLGSGVAENAVFLGKETSDTPHTTGFGFRVRKGSLYEEDASSAQHTDTKMTILFPWATLGSNINWCDLLVAGGTGPGLGCFSEVGSGAIHFNFTLRGDKATGSMLGNVPEGVFLDQTRVFIGGNGSLVGPVQGAFGALTGAGARYGGGLYAGLNQPVVDMPVEFQAEIYGSIHRLFISQMEYIAQLSALEAWYDQVRGAIAEEDPVRKTLYQAGGEMVRLNRIERIAQLGGLAGKMERSAHLLEKKALEDPRVVQQRALFDNWGKIEKALETYGQIEMPPALKQGLGQTLEKEGGAKGGKPAYTKVIQRLSLEAKEAGRKWLTEMSKPPSDLLALVPKINALKKN